MPLPCERQKDTEPKGDSSGSARARGPCRL